MAPYLYFSVCLCLQPLRSLSVCDSKLKTGMHILLSALGGHAALAEIDISGNNIGDTGAKILGKALTTNTRLRFTLTHAKAIAVLTSKSISFVFDHIMPPSSFRRSVTDKRVNLILKVFINESIAV